MSKSSHHNSYVITRNGMGIFKEISMWSKLYRNEMKKFGPEEVVFYQWLYH